MHTFTIAFLVALTLTTVTQLWLARRHVLHIAANRDQVPAGFSGSITLEIMRAAGALKTEAVTR